MYLRILSLLGLLLGWAQIGLAQQGGCQAVTFPVGVISVTGDVFRGLHAEDFAGRFQKKPLAVKSLTYDEGARRILIVLDASKKLSADSRRAESMLMESLLAAARPEDSFALQVARGPGRDVNFTTDHRAILDALSGESGRSGKDPGVLDSVMAGIEKFGAPQTGDAIVVIAADLEGNHKTNAKAVARALEEHHIRMFGLALGPVATRNVVAGGSVTSSMSQGLAWTTPGVGDMVYDAGDENFFPLTINSGGLVIGVMNLDQRRSYSISDARLQQEVRQKARSVSKMINAFYRMELDSFQISRSDDLNMDIAESIKKHTQQMFLLYPHTLDACSAGLKAS
jgi:hypothetical protein